jgi:hypothetical protein
MWGLPRQGAQKGIAGLPRAVASASESVVAVVAGSHDDDVGVDVGGVFAGVESAARRHKILCPSTRPQSRGHHHILPQVTLRG